MKRTQLRSEEFAQEVSNANYQLEITKKDQIELQEDEQKIIYLNQKPAFFYQQNKLIPTLKILLEKPLLKKITVDMGAIPFIIKGADIMRPGIKIIDPQIIKDEPLVIIDEKHQKPLAIGLALYNATEMQTLTTGKVIKNIHYI